MIAVDLGSNTFRAVALSCETLEPLAQYEKIVRTADRITETGKISKEAVNRIVAAAKEMRERLDGTEEIVAVTTEAIRRAGDAGEVLEEIDRRSGICFRVISGEEEAKYTLLAVKTRLKKLRLESERFVMADIGGGSTEIVFFDRGNILIESFPVGIVTVAQRYRELARIEEALPSLMGEMRSHIEMAGHRGFQPKIFVATAGTPTTVAAMKLGMEYATYDAGRVNGTLLNRDDLHAQLERLLSLGDEERQRLVGVGREDLIAAGILIFDHLYRLLGFEEAVVIDDGLREGVAIAACRNLDINDLFSEKHLPA